MRANSFFKLHKHGFTLVEMLVGIIIIGTAILMLSTLFFSQGNRSTEMLFEVRAAELGQSVMNEIWGKRFDENTDPNGSIPCGSANNLINGANAINNCSKVLGPEEASRHDWDDIDDFNGMTAGTELPIAIGSAKTYHDLYPEFKLSVKVEYENNTPTFETKLITVTVISPYQQDIVFNALRSNF